MIPQTAIRRNGSNATRAIGPVAALALLPLLMLAPLTNIRAQEASHASGELRGHPSSDVRINGNLAINQVVEGFSDGWNSHDAAAMCRRSPMMSNGSTGAAKPSTAARKSRTSTPCCSPIFTKTPTAPTR